jgi:signal transduction histidine kinase
MKKNPHLLILDDEMHILRSLERTFMDEPYGICTAHNPEEAMSLLEDKDIKVVMSDQRMPGTSGIEFLKHVKEKNPDTIRILFTGYADLNVAENAINQGEVFRLINKPWNEEDLKATIRQAIQTYDLSLEHRKLLHVCTIQNQSLKETNQKLTEVSAIQKEFLSTSAHELRTPLSAIKMSLDLILGGFKGSISDDQRYFLDMAKRHVDRLHRLINNLLNLSKLESHLENFVLMPADLNQLISDAATIHKPIAEQKGMGIETILDPRIGQIKMDADKINQVLTNLLTNALKYADQGEIRISTLLDTDKNMVQISIQDNGCGIRNEDIPKLFKKFSQVNPMPDKPNQGTGLGLAICKELIEQHSGYIWVESEWQKGSKFTFTLPYSS